MCPPWIGWLTCRTVKRALLQVIEAVVATGSINDLVSVLAEVPDEVFTPKWFLQVDGPR